MISKAKNPDQCIRELPPDRKQPMTQLRKTILDNLPEGFQEVMAYGMIGYVIPHSIYPPGYHVDPKLPLCLIAIASQKNFVALYHMGIYGDPKLLKWFKEEFAKSSPYKLDMGKSCIRFSKPEKIPFKLIGQLIKKVSVKDFIKTYEANMNNRKKG